MNTTTHSHPRWWRRKNALALIVISAALCYSNLSYLAAMTLQWNNPNDVSAYPTNDVSEQPHHQQHDSINQYLNNNITLETSQTTIVSAYFDVPSKRSSIHYEIWMVNFLSLRDAMVIFTTADMIPKMMSMRGQSLMNRTVFVPMSFNDTWIAKADINGDPSNYWNDQLMNKDPERDIHRSYEVFWIWLSKSWFVNEAIAGKVGNPFHSEVFVWSDIGSFRKEEYNDKTLVRHPEIIPQSALLIMAFRTPTYNNTQWIVKGEDYKENPTLWVSGSHIAGRIDSWRRFHKAFQVTLFGYVERELFVGEDQAVIQSTCLQHPSLCAIVTPDMVEGNEWFGLKDALHTGGSIFYRDSALLFRLPEMSPPPPPPSRRGVLCTLVHDEPDYILWRWATHHQRLGFDVVFYDHQSSHLPEWGDVVHAFPPDTCCEEDEDRCRLCWRCKSFDRHTNTRQHGYVPCQRASYADCLHRYGGKYEWIGNWDVDEYVFAAPGASSSLAAADIILSDNRRATSLSDDEGGGEEVVPVPMRRTDLVLAWLSRIDSEDYILPLVSSFRSVNSEATLVILLSEGVDAASEEMLRSIQRRFQFDIVRRSRPSGLRGKVSVRQAIFLDYLKEEGHRFNKVILSDAGDVLFQKDPFLYCWFPKEGACATVASEEDDRHYMRDEPGRNERRCLGADRFEAHLSHHMINNGFVRGNVHSMIAVLEEKVRRLRDNPNCVNEQIISNDMVRNPDWMLSSNCTIHVEPPNATCVQTMGIAFNVYHDKPEKWFHSQRPWTILSVPGDDSTVVSAVHMFNDDKSFAEEIASQLKQNPMQQYGQPLESGINNIDSTFWKHIEQYGSVEFQCLKFGPRQGAVHHRPGDPSNHQWRAPYAHLGDNTTICTTDVCESVGSVKRLSRTSAVVSMNTHVHILNASMRAEQWNQSTNKFRCHHFTARSKEYVHLKSERNHNSFLMNQLKSGVYNENGWFNTVHDASFVESNPNPPADVCVAFLSCMRLEKLQITYNGVQRLISSEPRVRFTTAIVDNGSSETTKKWIGSQQFNHTIMLDQNIGIAKAMDRLWRACGDARFILNVEDDWVYNEDAPSGIISQSMHILEDHSEVLEVWLRSHAPRFQYEANSTTCKNGHMVRQLPISSKPLSYYIQQSSKIKFPWWGAFTNGASLKHAARLHSLGSIYQEECGDHGNCESEFTAKIAYLDWKAVRLCWRNDTCLVTSDNEPISHVLFTHLGGIRSPGHDNTTQLG